MLTTVFTLRHALITCPATLIAAHLRLLLESIRPEMRQYFFEGDKNGARFSRDKRAIAYQRAKCDLDKRPFGTQYDVYEEQYEWLHHAIASTRQALPMSPPIRRSGWSS